MILSYQGDSCCVSPHSKHNFSANGARVNAYIYTRMELRVRDCAHRANTTRMVRVRYAYGTRMVRVWKKVFYAYYTRKLRVLYA